MSEAQRALVRSWLSTHHDLELAFADLDVNGDGYVADWELTNGSRQSAFGTKDGYYGDPTCEAIMAMADTDGDGKISLAEFLQLGAVLQEVAALRAELEAAPPAAAARAGATAECLRAYWAEGTHQCNAWMFFGTGRTLSTDFPLGTTLAAMKARFEDNHESDFRGEVTMVWGDGSETAHTF